MRLVRLFCTLLMGFCYMIAAQAQSLASYNEVGSDAVHIAVSNIKAEVEDPKIKVDRELTMSAEELTINSLERYLNGLIWNENRNKNKVSTPSCYAYLEEHLANLQEDFGDDPFYFDRYYHPETQYLTGCNIGRAGMPIIEVKTLSDGKKAAILTTRTEHASLYYTTDGRIPNNKSEQYSAPIILEPGVKLMVKAIRDDLEHSPILQWNDVSFERVENGENLNENTIMGIFPLPTTEKVLVKYKTKAMGEIAISLIDMNRKVHHIDFIQAEEAKFGQCHVDVSKVPTGAYLIKFKFENGKTTYRQMMKK